MTRKNSFALVRYFGRNLLTVVGIVLIWRGVWYILDLMDDKLFGGYHFITAVGGIILGLVLLYFPDKSLKKIEKL